jgi:hypothetical protein
LVGGGRGCRREGEEERMEETGRRGWRSTIEDEGVPERLEAGEPA